MHGPWTNKHREFSGYFSHNYPSVFLFSCFLKFIYIYQIFYMKKYILKNTIFSVIRKSQIILHAKIVPLSCAAKKS